MFGAQWHAFMCCSVADERSDKKFVHITSMFVIVTLAAINLAKAEVYVILRLVCHCPAQVYV
jgi:hypothetical protein